MGLFRGGPSCARAMARLGAVRSHYCALLLAAALAVCAFYYLGSGRETFSSATKRLKEARAGVPAAPSPPAPELARVSLAPALGAKAKSLEGGGAGPVDYHLLMMFTKAEHNAALQAKARVALRSLLRLAKFEAHEVLNLHFVSEEASREVAKALLRELLPPAAGFKCKVVFHDVAVLTDKLFPVVEAMQKHFSAGSGTYYSDSIFFLSVAMHQIMPKAPCACDAGKQAAASVQKEQQCQAKKLRQNPEHTLGQSNEEERDCSLEATMRPRPTEVPWIPSWHQDLVPTLIAMAGDAETLPARGAQSARGRTIWAQASQGFQHCPALPLRAVPESCVSRGGNEKKLQKNVCRSAVAVGGMHGPVAPTMVFSSQHRGSIQPHILDFFLQGVKGGSYICG
ncbi:hypothetical protein PAL_GLEAN10007393 [Pteropus alecto]|uniref:Xyloside xylosyltransferase 1 n=1 Tax=Pteropus alecto TaxID=9402 RepID=L5L1V0_PTEAL|nr:hypothetical protein PAL_GLEAN10007393 [Pteropus alecto]